MLGLVTLETSPKKTTTLTPQGAQNLNASGGYIASLGNTAMASVLLNGKPQLGQRKRVYKKDVLLQWVMLPSWKTMEN